MVPSFPMTSADRLRQDAAAREAEARELERREVPRNGAITAGQAIADVDELVKAATDDPWKIGPRVDLLRAWATEAKASGVRRTSSGRDADALRFQLVWRDGVIVAGESSCTAAPQPLAAGVRLPTVW